MATPVNDRDVLIMGATPRFTPPTDRGMYLTPPAAIFKLSADGKSASPSSFTFTANMLNLPGTVTWSTSGGISLTTSGNTAVLNFASFSAGSGTVTASITVDGQTFTQTATVTKIADGTSGAGTPGPRGAGHFYVAGSSWSDTIASAACPGGPTINDVVTISNNSDFVNEKYWDGSAWQQQGIVIPGSLIVPKSVTTTQIDARGLVIRDASGNPILGLGNTLPLSYAAPGTVNADLLPGINNAATTATWGGVSGTGKPADNATVGAPTGTYVGGTEAGMVASRALNGDSAYNAIPGINSSLSDKLSKTVSSALQTQITLATSGAIAVGNASWGSAGFGGSGVVMTPYGLAGIVGGVPKFYIGTDGNPYFAGALAAGIVKASNIAVGSPDNIVPDPGFQDLTWWNRTGFTVNDYSGSNTFWKTGRALTIDAAHGAKSETLTSSFPMTPGATYYVEFQLFLTNDFAGSLSVLWLIPNVMWHTMGGPTTGYFWPDGRPEMFNVNSPKGAQTFSATYTVPTNGYTSSTQLQIKSIVSAGACQIGSVSITRVADSTIIGPGQVQTKHLFLSQGGDISSGQTSYGVGNGFWMEGAGNGHGARMSMGDSASGKQFLCDPANGVLGLFGANLSGGSVSGSTTLPKPVVTGTGPITSTGANGNRSWNLSVSASGGSGTFTYSWAFGGGTDPVFKMSGNTSSSAVTVSVSGSNNQYYALCVCTVTDSNGLSTVFTVSIVVTFGTPA